jgi:hypothetical protein
MANRQQGEVSLRIGDTTYTLKLGTYQMGLAEDAAGGASLETIFSKAAKGSLKFTLVLFWAALQKYHAKEFPTIEAVGDLIDRSGGIMALGAQLKALTASATPDPADLKELGVAPGANPPVARARSRRGTGGGSTSRPAPAA